MRFAKLRHRLTIISGISLIVVLIGSIPKLSGQECPLLHQPWHVGPVDAIAATGHLIVFLQGANLVVGDVSDATQPPLILGQTEIPELPITQPWLSVGLGVAFVGMPDAVAVVDISEPEQPFVASELPPPEGAARFAVDGTRVYIGNGQYASVYDVSDPSTPQLLFSDGRIPGTLGPFTVHDSTLFSLLSDGAQMVLLTMDVSDPSIPVFLRMPPLPMDPNDGIYTKSYGMLGDTLFVAAWHHSSMLFSVNVSTPCQPDFLQKISIPNSQWRSPEDMVITEGGTIVLASGPFHPVEPPYVLQILDASNPHDMQFMGDFGAFDSAISVAASGSRVFVGSEDGISLLETCDTTSPHQLWLDIVAHNSGQFGSEWRTDVVVKNLENHATDLRLILHGPDGDSQLIAAVEPQNMAVFEDIVGLMNAEGKGSLEILCDQPIRALGRIYSGGANGTEGQFIQSRLPENALKPDESALLLGLRQVEGEFRSNVALSNPGEENAEACLALFSANSQQAGETTCYELPPKAVIQIIEPFKTIAGQPDLGWGFAEVNVVSGSVFCSGSVIDSHTNDPTTIPSTP